ncbi:MAG: thiosulfate sulfurtransferase [Alphaproteobacteria bacterium]|nr:MAG: thiosulfate sulfurtransferase [Alphaproteobacteria bacterium]
MADVRRVGAAALRAMLTDEDELALIDVREEGVFSEGHLLFARSVPLSRLELRMARLVPRRATRIVLVDDADGLAERAAKVLAKAGYTDLHSLDGGNAGWAAAGYELFSGVNVPSKAFGEFVEHEAGTPSVSADELHALMQSGADMVVLDSRPFDEYSRVSIPSGVNVPGAELVLRVHDMAPSPETLVVVNCAGRTRSIIGAQSLIDAGVPNKVVALRNGTMGWSLAGLRPDSGRSQRAPEVSHGALAWAKAAAEAVARKLGIRSIDEAALEQLRADERRTTYVFDVRDPAEYLAGHVPGALSAPGGQLVQATDQYAGTLKSRIVCVDDREVRAVMTASWLRRMGWQEVFVLVAAGAEKGFPENPVLGEAPRDAAIDAAALSELLARSDATVIDLSLSREYLSAHIAGSWFAIRSRLQWFIQREPLRRNVVLTSEDGVLAGLAVPDVRAFTPLPVRYLSGGNAAWRAAGLPLTAEDPRMADGPIDAWLKPYERPDGVAQAMADYLAWETDLLPRIARDGCARFEHFP